MLIGNQFFLKSNQKQALSFLRHSIFKRIEDFKVNDIAITTFAQTIDNMIQMRFMLLLSEQTWHIFHDKEGGTYRTNQINENLSKFPLLAIGTLILACNTKIRTW